MLFHLLLSCVCGLQSNLPLWPDDFKWSSAGRPSGYDCIQILEGADPHTWNDNYFCWRNYKRNPGLKWRSWGKISNMRCVQILERSDPHTWDDNYLCESHDSPYRFSWSSAGPQRGKQCIKWEERSDPHTWHDNYLCSSYTTSSLPNPVFPIDFRWSSAGIPNGWDCERILERSDPHTWDDNYFCWRTGKRNLGVRWSSSGSISGKRCTRITEPRDPHTWTDNYLCLSTSAYLRLYWSSNGEIRGKTCMKWYEGSDPYSWDNNFLCANEAGGLKDPVFPNDFRFSYSDVPLGYDCERIVEPSDPHTWHDNYLCWRHGKRNPQIRWSYSGSINGMRCTRTVEPSDPHTWDDNYLCVPETSSLRFYWSYAGHPIGKNCLRWHEPSDPHTWNDNYLCTNKDNLPDPVFPRDFRWSSSGIPSGYDCERILENSDPNSWHDNYFCWRQGKRDPGIRWSMAGPIGGMRCTHIQEKSDPHTWHDNYLCVPWSSSLRFYWSSSGTMGGKTCIRWYESKDPHTWDDNYLCANPDPGLPEAVFPQDFKWSSSGVPFGYDCERILETSDPHTWDDNFFCWKQDRRNPGIRWSMSGSLDGMRCTRIIEPSDPFTWDDNYLCVPNSSKLRLIWSYRGAKPGHECIQWHEGSDPHTWDDNYLCDEQCNQFSCTTPDDYQKIENRCIRGHVHKNYLDVTLQTCASKCDDAQNCKSFNWRPVKGSNCETSLVNKVDAHASYHDCFSDGWSYYEKMTFSSELVSLSFSASSLRSHNWMKGLDGSKQLSLFSIPGTHDAAARDHLLEYVNCQTWNINSQLHNGVRFFDMRVQSENDKWIMVHGDFKLGFDFHQDMLKPMYKFLEEYPSECITMRIKRDSGVSDGYSDIFAKYVEEMREKWLLQEEVPTLDMCRGKIFVLRDEWGSSDFNIRKWSIEQIQDEYELSDQWMANRRRGVFGWLEDRIEDAVDVAKDVAGVVTNTVGQVVDVVEDIVEVVGVWADGGFVDWWKEDFLMFSARIGLAGKSWLVETTLTQFIIAVDFIHNLGEMVGVFDGMDADKQKLMYILKFHNEEIAENFDDSSLHINFWSYFEYSRIGAEGKALPQFNSVTAEKMRRYDIIPQLLGDNLGICVFDFPTKFQLEQVFCRNYGSKNGNCFK